MEVRTPQCSAVLPRYMYKNGMKTDRTLFEIPTFPNREIQRCEIQTNIAVFCIFLLFPFSINNLVLHNA